jgi:hypothetical protein
MQSNFRSKDGINFGILTSLWIWSSHIFKNFVPRLLHYELLIAVLDTILWEIVLCLQNLFLPCSKRCHMLTLMVYTVMEHPTIFVDCKCSDEEVIFFSIFMDWILIFCFLFPSTTVRERRALDDSNTRYCRGSVSFISYLVSVAWFSTSTHTDKS